MRILAIIAAAPVGSSPLAGHPAHGIVVTTPDGNPILANSLVNQIGLVEIE